MGHKGGNMGLTCLKDPARQTHLPEWYLWGHTNSTQLYNPLNPEQP